MQELNRIITSIRDSNLPEEDKKYIIDQLNAKGFVDPELIIYILKFFEIGKELFDRIDLN